MTDLLTTFYDSFARLDAEAMVRCYHPDVLFHDPAFGRLEGERARNMWRMLCASQQGKDFTVTFRDIRADERTGSAHWEARYTFSPSGRRVHNIIEASFTFRDGLIHTHTDQFNLHRWARQALGMQGLLLGGTRYFQKQLQARTRGMLTKWEGSL
ncbi:MAG: nuclear transport factor 2 family protein [Lewinella sp.]|nr:nuclear transport factor 2 family protein [Lewinella sp.]